MKSLALSLGLVLSFAACRTTHTAPTEADMSTLSNQSTPQIDEDGFVNQDATLQDPEGDIAPLVPCRDGEIERRQSGKIVCVRPDDGISGSTMTGR